MRVGRAARREMKRALGRGSDCAKCELPTTRFVKGSYDWEENPKQTQTSFWDECRSCGYRLFYKAGTLPRLRIDNPKRDRVPKPDSVGNVETLSRASKRCFKCGSPFWRMFDTHTRLAWDECFGCGTTTPRKGIVNELTFGG